MIKNVSPKILAQYKGKTCVMRIDLNIELGQESYSYRIESIVPTIQMLLRHNIKVVLISHKGRPKSYEKSLSLRPFVKILSKKIGAPVHFLPQLNFPVAQKEIRTNTRARIFLLENIRFVPDEAKNNAQFAKKLASLGDFYINEAFAVCHRKAASISAITRFLPSYAGLWLTKEIDNLNRLMKRSAHPFTLVLGGYKISEKIEVIEYFGKKADFFLIGGGSANAFFAAKNLPIKKSVIDKDAIPFARKWVANPKVLLPRDVKWSNQCIFDIGPKSVELFSDIIKKSKTILWNGPMGFFEKKQFSYGSFAVARAIASSKAFSVVGGGETSSIIAKLHLQKKISFISTGGGAMLEYLSGKKLPGIIALQ